MGKVSDTVEGGDLLGLEIADAKVSLIAFGLGSAGKFTGSREACLKCDITNTHTLTA